MSELSLRLKETRKSLRRMGFPAVPSTADGRGGVEEELDLVGRRVVVTRE